MNRLIQQILRFGVVGVVSTLVDFVIYTIMCNVLHIPYLISGLSGFCISLVVNYVLSMRFVFKRRDDISRKKEFALFAGMSLIGLWLNELILFLCIDIFYANSSFMESLISEPVMNVLAKAAATGVVMVYNFVSRKLVLESR